MPFIEIYWTVFTFRADSKHLPSESLRSTRISGRKVYLRCRMGCSAIWWVIKNDTEIGRNNSQRSWTSILLTKLISILFTTRLSILGGPSSNALQDADVVVTSEEVCREAYNATQWNGLTDQRVICAGNGAKDSCKVRLLSCLGSFLFVCWGGGLLGYCVVRWTHRELRGRRWDRAGRVLLPPPP